MPYRINHIHLKSPDPLKTAQWYVNAFGFKINSDEVRVFGDRFIRCSSAEGGINVNISGARAGETLGPGDASAHHGLEHFGLDSTDIEGDIKRLEGLGAQRLEGPINMANGGRIAFLRGPDDTRLELVQAPRKGKDPARERRRRRPRAQAARPFTAQARAISARPPSGRNGRAARIRSRRAARRSSASDTQ